MRIPPEAYSAPITDYQFRLLATICHLAGSRGQFKASAEELGRQTGNVHERTVRRALKALREAGLISTTATKRANGYNGKLDISVTPEVDSNVRTEGGTNVRTSHDYLSGSNTVDIPLVPNSKDSNKYFETKGFTKEILVPMKNYDDGEDLAGFGLVEPKDAPQAKVRKSDPKTRGKRPQHEWTPMDVAAEFSFLVGRKYPLLPGTVNVKQLSGALAKFRKQYDTTALIELELLRLFMADDRNFRTIGDEAPHLYKLYLASFRTNMNRARENLGLGRVAPIKEPVVKIGTLTASDGRVFQNSMSGRVQLERYEQRLKEKSNG